MKKEKEIKETTTTTTFVEKEKPQNLKNTERETKVIPLNPQKTVTVDADVRYLYEKIRPLQDQGDIAALLSLQGEYGVNNLKAAISNALFTKGETRVEEIRVQYIAAILHRMKSEGCNADCQSIYDLLPQLTPEEIERKSREREEKLAKIERDNALLAEKEKMEAEENRRRDALIKPYMEKIEEVEREEKAAQKSEDLKKLNKGGLSAWGAAKWAAITKNQERWNRINGARSLAELEAVLKNELAEAKARCAKKETGVKMAM